MTNYAYYQNTGHRISKPHWYGPYEVWQRKRFIGKRWRYLSALKLAQDSGAR